MTAWEAATPGAGLYRIARWPDPLAFSPRAFCGSERFDDPLGIFRVPLPLLAKAKAVGNTVASLPSAHVAPGRGPTDSVRTSRAAAVPGGAGIPCCRQSGC
jgi:hypothetical protein